MDEKRKKLSQRQKNKQNRKPHVHSVKQPHFAKDVRINLRRAKFKSKRKTESESGSESGSEAESSIKPQPNRDLLSLDNISDDEDSEQESENYVKAPISEGAHFIGIPLNECVGMKDACFKTRQLIYMQSEAEATKEHEKMVKDGSKIDKLKKSVQLDDALGTEIRTDIGREEDIKSERRDLKSSEFQSLEEDLDFLLTLKEPVKAESIIIPQITSTSKLEEKKNKFTSKPIKSIDLEKWLDSVLDM